jgi:hypothetical protein
MNISFSLETHQLTLKSLTSDLQFSVEAHQTLSFSELGFSYLFYLLGFQSYVRLDVESGQFWIKENDLKTKITPLLLNASPSRRKKSNTRIKPQITIIENLGDASHPWSQRVQEVLAAIEEIKRVSNLTPISPSLAPKVSQYERAITGDLEAIDGLIQDLKSNKPISDCIKIEGEDIKKIKSALIKFHPDKTGTFSLEAQAKAREITVLLNEIKDFPALSSLCEKDDLSDLEYQKLEAFADSCYTNSYRHRDLTDRKNDLLDEVEAKLERVTVNKLNNLQSIIQTKLAELNITDELDRQIPYLIEANELVSSYITSRYIEELTGHQLDQISRAKTLIKNKLNEILAHKFRAGLGIDEKLRNFNHIQEQIDASSLSDSKKVIMKQRVLDYLMADGTRSSLFDQAFAIDATCLKAVERFNTLNQIIGQLKPPRRAEVETELRLKFGTKDFSFEGLIRDYQLLGTIDSEETKEMAKSLLDSSFDRKMEIAEEWRVRLLRGKTFVGTRRGGHISGTREDIAKFQAIKRVSTTFLGPSDLTREEKAIFDRLFQDKGIVYKMVKHAVSDVAIYRPEAGFDDFQADIKLTKDHLLVKIGSKRLIIPLAG